MLIGFENDSIFGFVHYGFLDSILHNGADTLFGSVSDYTIADAYFLFEIVGDCTLFSGLFSSISPLVWGGIPNLYSDCDIRESSRIDVMKGMIIYGTVVVSFVMESSMVLEQVIRKGCYLVLIIGVFPSEYESSYDQIIQTSRNVSICKFLPHQQDYLWDNISEGESFVFLEFGLLKEYLFDSADGITFTDTYGRVYCLVAGPSQMGINFQSSVNYLK